MINYDWGASWFWGTMTERSQPAAVGKGKGRGYTKPALKKKRRKH